MIGAAGIFTDSMGFDIGVITGLVTILGAIGSGFAWIIAMLKEQKKTRAEETRAVVTELINSAPDKIVVSPQPLIVKLEERFVTHDDLKELTRRVGVLENWRESDKRELRDLIDGIPARVIATLKDVWGMKK